MLNMGGKAQRPFFHRNTPADRGVIQQVFVNQDYALERLARATDIQNLYNACVASGRTPMILDAGANLGAYASSCIAHPCVAGGASYQRAGHADATPASLKSVTLRGNQPRSWASKNDQCSLNSVRKFQKKDLRRETQASMTMRRNAGT